MRNWLTALSTCLIPILLIAPLWSLWSGDGIIHLRFAEMAIEGDWFAFNPKEISAGTTSLGWTLVNGFFLALLGWFWGLVAIKVITLASFVGIAWLLLGFARGLALPELISAALVLVFALNPGALYNAPLGMEQPLFALLALILIATRFSPIIAVRGTTWHAGLSGFLAGFLLLLRPEGLIVCSVLAIGSLCLVIFETPTKNRLIKWLLWVLTASSISLLGSAFQYVETGQFFLSQSAKSRLFMSHLDSLHIFGPIWFDYRPSLRLLLYLPVTLGFFGGAWLAFRRLSPLWRGVDTIERKNALAVFLGSLSVLLGWTVYSFLSGSHHTGRYMTWMVPVLVMACMYFCSECLKSKTTLARPKLWISLSFVLLIPVYGIEWWARARMFQATLGQKYATDGLPALANAVDPEVRRAYTDKLLEPLLSKSQPPRFPVSIALTEVQLRFFVDDRVRIVSMDGRTSPVGSPQFINNDGTLNLDIFLQQVRPDYIVEIPQGKNSHAKRMMRAWFALKPGEAVDIGNGQSLERTIGGLHLRSAQVGGGHSLHN